MISENVSTGNINERLVQVLHEDYDSRDPCEQLFNVLLL